MSADSLIKHLPELEFTIVAVTHECYIDFTIYDVIGWGEGATPGVYDAPLWHKAGSDLWPDTVGSIQEAEPCLHGSVEWDGCSDWYFDEQDRVMLHGCSRQDVLRFGEVMAVCWDWAAELLGAIWDG